MIFFPRFWSFLSSHRSSRFLRCGVLIPFRDITFSRLYISDCKRFVKKKLSEFSSFIFFCEFEREILPVWAGHWLIFLDFFVNFQFLLEHKQTRFIPEALMMGPGNGTERDGRLGNKTKLRYMKGECNGIQTGHKFYW